MQMQIPKQFWGILQKGETVEDGGHVAILRIWYLGPARKGLKLTYCTDTRPVDAIREECHAFGSVYLRRYVW